MSCGQILITAGTEVAPDRVLPLRGLAHFPSMGWMTVIVSVLQIRGRSHREVKGGRGVTQVA